MLFKKDSVAATGDGDFGYLSDKDVYMDVACQSLRPTVVTETMQDYYRNFNSCGERVKYDWGLKVDEKVNETRSNLLKLLKCSPKKYFTSFTLNTTYGLNLILSQLKADGIDRVITSEIEHNSVFLTTVQLAKRLDVPREILKRRDDGSVIMNDVDFTNAVVVLNAVSNIDGRQLKNIKEVADKTHQGGGIFIVDGAQAMSFYYEMLRGVDFDALCFSSHKMYGPSLGGIIAKKSLLDRLQLSVLGGGMVDDVRKNDYILLDEQDEEIHTALEPGLQAYAEIIGLGAAVKWLPKAEKGNHILEYAGKLLDFLNSANGFHVLNSETTQTVSFYHDKVDSNLLSQAMSDAGIMARSGHFCCHYYLAHVKKYPALIRLSLGLHNRESDIDKFIDTMKGLAQ